jgi:hypothetical protein
MIHIITYSILILLVLRLGYLNLRYSSILRMYSLEFDVMQGQVETMGKLLADKLKS